MVFPKGWLEVLSTWLKTLLMVAGWLACLHAGWLAGSLACFLACFQLLACCLPGLLARMQSGCLLWLTCMAGLLASWLVCLLACLSPCPLACWLACLLAGWLAWLAWLAGWLACVLACLLACLFACCLARLLSCLLALPACLAWLLACLLAACLLASLWKDDRGRKKNGEGEKKTRKIVRLSLKDGISSDCREEASANGI